MYKVLNSCPQCQIMRRGANLLVCIRPSLWYKGSTREIFKWEPRYVIQRLTQFACVVDVSGAPVIIAWLVFRVRINHSDIIAAIKQQLPLFLPLTSPQLHVCAGRGIRKKERNFCSDLYDGPGFDPVLLLEACHHPIQLSVSTWKWPDNVFYATFGSFWAARAFKWWSVLSGPWVNMSYMHVPAASFLKLQQTGQRGEFMKSPLQAHS